MKNFYFFTIFILFASSTLAYFSDSEHSASTYTTGQVDLKVWKDGWIDNPGRIVNVEIKPCEYEEEVIRIKNNGNNPALLDLGISNVRDLGGEFTEEERRFDADNMVNNLSYHTFAGISVNCESFSLVLVNDDNKTVHELDGLTFYTPSISPGEVCDIHFKFHINSSAGNEYQGDVIRFDIALSLHQCTECREEETCWAIGGDFEEFSRGWGGYFHYHGDNIQLPIVAGQHTDAGHLNIENAGDGKLRITYHAENGWKLLKTHLYVGDCPPPNSAPGQFPYKHEFVNSNFDEYIVDAGDCIAAHGEVER